MQSRRSRNQSKAQRVFVQVICHPILSLESLGLSECKVLFWSYHQLQWSLSDYDFSHDSDCTFKNLNLLLLPGLPPTTCSLYRCQPFFIFFSRLGGTNKNTNSVFSFCRSFGWIKCMTSFVAQAQLPCRENSFIHVLTRNQVELWLETGVAPLSNCLLTLNGLLPTQCQPSAAT